MVKEGSTGGEEKKGEPKVEASTIDEKLFSILKDLEAMEEKDSTGREEKTEKVESALREERKEEPKVKTSGLEDKVLSLLQDFGEIEKISALRELKVSSQAFDSCVEGLEKDGWVKVRDRELENYYVELTKKSRERIKQLKELLKEGEKQKPKSVKDLLSSIIKLRNIFRLFSTLKNIVFKFTSGWLNFLGNNIIDLTIVAALLVVLYLVQMFVMDPNQRIMNFLVAVILFSDILFVYRNSKKKLKTQTVMGKILGFLKIVTGEWKLIIFLTSIVMLVYFASWIILYPGHIVLAILLCTMVLSSIIQIYYPLKPRKNIPKFYLGMLVLVYSMLLLIGVAEISTLLLGYESRPLDMAVGIALMALNYTARESLGIKLDYFKKMISKLD